MAKDKIEFEIGDIVTFQPYREAMPARVVEVDCQQHNLFGSGKVNYRLTGTAYKNSRGHRKYSTVESVTSGISIQESQYYDNEYRLQEPDFYIEPVVETKK